MADEESVAEELVREFKATRAALRENTDALTRLAVSFEKVVAVEPPQQKPRAQDLGDIASEVVGDVAARAVSNLFKRRKK